MDSEGEQEDRLSSLPDPLLIHILSFLPIPDAVKTMVIKRFGNLWTSLPNLDLDDCFFPLWDDGDGDDDDDEEPSSSDLPLFHFARNLLMRHINPKIDKFRVNINEIYFSDIEARNLTHELDSWINFALRKQVQVLEFFVGMVEPDEVLYKLPHSEFISDSLIDLKLEWMEMKLQKRVQMGLLRILRVIRVDINEEVFREIIIGCPLLKELEIYNCWGLNELSFDAPNVEKLKLDTTEDYDFGHILRINCPSLRAFDFTGFVDCVEIINLSSLVDVTFNLRCRNMEFKEFPQFIAVLKKIVHAKTVSLSCEFVTVLFYCMLKDVPRILLEWKHVELSIWLTDKHIPGIAHLLRNSSYLEELVIHLANWHRDFLEPIELELDIYITDEEGSWSSLKNITIYNISNAPYHLLVRLVEILLKKALVLEELIIYYKGNNKSSGEFKLTSEELEEFSEKLPTFSKASQYAKVSLL